MSIVEKLLRTAETHDPHVRAAVRLLHQHGKWLRDNEFLGTAVYENGHGEAYVRWADARELFDEGSYVRASSTERAVLDLAIEVGRDRFRLSRLDATNSGLVLAAMAAALVLDTQDGR